jgi:putative ABC transport system substrate-binding protein
MPDKIGFLIAPKLGDWTRYVQWFNAKLVHNIPIKKWPANGANGDPQTIRDAANLLANDRDIKVIVTAGTGAALACKAATQSNRKPFVFASVGDPMLSGLVPVPGSQDNFTGGNNRQADQRVVNRRVDYMLSDSTFLEPFAVVGNYNNQPAKTAMDYAYDYLTRFKGKQAQLASITPQDDIDDFISDLSSQPQPIRSLFVCSDLFLTVNSTDLNRAAHNTTPPMKTMFEFEEHKQVHGADDYFGSDFKEMFEKAANYVDEILDGARPSDLPIYIASLKGRRPWPIIRANKEMTDRKKRSLRNKK